MVVVQTSSAKPAVRPVVLAVRAGRWEPGVRTVVRDSRTGTRIVQLSAGEATTHHPYVYCNAFDSNEESVVVSSDRTGSFQLFQIRIATGEVRQLTYHEGLAHLGHATSPSGREAVYVVGSAIWATDLQSGQTRLVSSLEQLLEGASPDHRVAITACETFGYIWFKGAEGCATIARFAFAGSEPEIVARLSRWERITHLRVCPADAGLLSFNPAPDVQDDARLAPAERARVWILDVRTGKSKAFFAAPVGMRATHEHWSPDGSRLYTHLKTVPAWTPTSVVSVDREGGDLREHYRSTHQLLGHSSVNRDQTKLLIDNQRPAENEILMVDLASGKADVLCWPNASGRPHPNHVHPAFSPSGRYVIYTSDASGSAQVCLIDLEDRG